MGSPATEEKLSLKLDECVVRLLERFRAFALAIIER